MVSKTVQYRIIAFPPPAPQDEGDLTFVIPLRQDAARCVSCLRVFVVI
jgi:hypothetical protein